MGRTLGRGLLGLVLALGVHAAAWAAPPLWVVRDADSALYLFGTMHVLTEDAAWRTPAFDKALAESSRIWLELDTQVAPETMAKLVVDLGVDRKTPLAQKVSPETMAALRERVKGQPKLAEMAEHMRPWAAAMAIQAMPVLAAGHTSEAGADATLTREMTEGGKQTLFFETPEQQLRFFADLPEAVQVQFLEDSLEQTAGKGRTPAETQAAWIAGDERLLGDGVAADMRARRPALYDAFVRQRNRVWTKALEGELAGSGVAMVAVGALHMAGDDGLVAQLRARGFTVERVQ